MNPLSQISVDLKQKGYPQDIRVGDMTFAEKGNQYVEFRGDIGILGPNWVKVPSLVNIQNQLRDCNYTLIHSSSISSSGDVQENWSLSEGNSGITLTDENIWVVMAKYWEFKKGK